MKIPDAWSVHVGQFKDIAREAGRDLAGKLVWLGRSRADGPAKALGDALEASVRLLGGEVADGGDGPRSLPCGVVLDGLERANAIVMLAQTPGVCAEALDFAAGNPALTRAALPRMDVLLPQCHTAGYMFRRLKDHGAMVSVYEDRHAEDGTLATNSLNNVMKIVKGEERDELARRNPDPSIGIVTALQLEFDAVRNILTGGRADIRNDEHGFRTYHRASVPAPDEGYHGVVVGRSRVGNNAAAAAATDLLRDHPTVEVLLMVGIAAGIPDLADASKDIRRGDIVVSDEFGVVQYDMKKSTPSGDVPTSRPRAPSYPWLSIAEDLGSRSREGAPAWWSTLDAVSGAVWARPEIDELSDEDDPEARTPIKRPADPTRDAGRPRIHFGAIGSANIVMRTASERDRVKRQFGVVAVEMEGSGIAEVAWRRTMGYLVVRGICDYANADKDKVWQHYAALAAAAFARSLIEAMPVRSTGSA